MGETLVMTVRRLVAFALSFWIPDVEVALAMLATKMRRFLRS